MSNIEPRKSKSPPQNQGRQHRHVHGHQHQHGDGHYRPQKVVIRVLKWPKQATRRSGSVSEDDRSSQDQSGHEKECQLCVKLRQVRTKSGNLMAPTPSSDVVVRAADGKNFYCHSFVFDVWAPSLLTNTKSPCEGQRRQFQIDVPDFDSQVVGACLHLMYGGMMDRMPVGLLTDIMHLANKYQIPDLKVACLKAASVVELTPGNACHLWYYASMHKVQQLQKKTMRFVLDNMDAIATDPQGRPAWDEMIKKPEMMVELVYGISECTNAKPMPSPPRDTQMDELWNKSDGLQKAYGYPDLVVVTKDQRSFHVHLPVITLSAPNFANMLHEEGSKNDGRVHMNDFDSDVVEEFLRGVYRQETSPAFPKVVDHVYVLTCEYNVDQLADACEREMAKSRLGSTEEVIELLKEAEEHMMPAAKPLCLRYLFGLGRQLEKNEAWKNLAKEYPLLIAEMVVDWEQYRQRK